MILSFWKLRSMLILLLFFVKINTPAYAQSLLFFDDFNAENNGQGALAYASFSKWNVTRPDVDLIGNGYFDIYPGNGLYVDMGGFTGGKLETKTNFSLNRGTYEIQFSLGNNSNTDPCVFGLGTVYVDILSPVGGTPPLQTIQRTFRVENAAEGRIFFDQLGNDFNGITIDNVRLTKRSSSVPAPGSLFTVLIGVVPGVLLLRRRRK